MNKQHFAGNRDRCGRCGTIHGGNDHSCPVHGPAAAGCCQPACKPEEWELLPAAVEAPPWGAPSRWRPKAGWLEFSKQRGR